MTSKKLSELQGTNAVDSADLFLVTNGVDSKKITRQDLFQLIFNTTMNKIGDLPTMDEADANSDLTGNSILVVNNGVEKIIPLSELKKVVEEAAAAVAYDDTVTNFSVDNVQDAIEALFSLVSTNPGTVYITDVTPTASGSVTSKVYSSGSLVTFDTDTVDITVAVTASIANPLVAPTVDVNGTAVTNFVPAGGGIWTGTVDISITGNVDIVATNAAGSIASAAATLISAPSPTILAAYFAGSNAGAPWTDTYSKITTWLNANPRVPGATTPPPVGSISGYQNLFNPGLMQDVTELAMIPNGHIFLIVETSGPIDQIEVISDAVDKVIPAGVYTATNISGNMYWLNGVYTSGNFGNTPTMRGNIIRARATGLPPGPVFNTRIDPNTVPANCYAALNCNSAMPSYVCNVNTNYAYPVGQGALKNTEAVTITFASQQNISAIDNDYFIFHSGGAGGTVQLAAGQNTDISATKIFERVSGDYNYSTSNLWSWAVKKSNGMTNNSGASNHVVRMAHTAATLQVIVQTVDTNNLEDIGVPLSGNKVRSGGTYGTANQVYWVTLFSNQILQDVNIPDNDPTMQALPANSGVYLDPIFVVYAENLSTGTSQLWKRRISIADTDTRGVKSIVLDSAPNLAGIQSALSPSADSFEIKGFVQRPLIVVETGIPYNIGANVVNTADLVAHKGTSGGTVMTYGNSILGAADSYAITTNTGTLSPTGNHFYLRDAALDGGNVYIEEL